MGYFTQIQPKIEYLLEKANIVVDALNRRRPPRDVDSKFISSKTQSQDKAATSVVGMDISTPQDQEILHLIQASAISLSKQEIHQLIVTQEANPNMQKMAAQS